MIEAPIAIRKTTVYVGVCIIPIKQPILEMILWIMDRRRRIFFLNFDTRNAIFLKEIDGNDRRRRIFFEILTPEMQFSLRKSMDLK